MVHFYRPNAEEPWATLHTKRRGGIDLALYGPSGRFALGKIAALGCDREIIAAAGKPDLIRIRLDSESHVRDTAFVEVPQRAPPRPASRVCQALSRRRTGSWRQHCVVWTLVSLKATKTRPHLLPPSEIVSLSSQCFAANLEVGWRGQSAANGRGFSQVERTISFDIAAVESQAMAPVLPQQGHRLVNRGLVLERRSSDRLKNGHPSFCLGRSDPATPQKTLAPLCTTPIGMRDDLLRKGSEVASDLS